MAGELLLDTGGLVSLLDRSQSGHAAFAAFFDRWTGPVVTSEAVLTEATHLLRRGRGGADACLAFVVNGGAAVVPSTTSSLGRCRALMRRYEDLPMDFADATLVVLAEELETDVVCTTDRRDFGVYRIGGSRPFRIVPDPSRPRP